MKHPVLVSFNYHIAGYFRGGKISWFSWLCQRTWKLNLEIELRTYTRVHNPWIFNHECQKTVKPRIFSPSEITCYTVVFYSLPALASGYTIFNGAKWAKKAGVVRKFICHVRFVYDGVLFTVEEHQESLRNVNNFLTTEKQPWKICGNGGHSDNDSCFSLEGLGFAKLVYTLASAGREKN